jgi:hypothetical protein
MFAHRFFLIIFYRIIYVWRYIYRIIYVFYRIICVLGKFPETFIPIRSQVKQISPFIPGSLLSESVLTKFYCNTLKKVTSRHVLVTYWRSLLLLSGYTFWTRAFCRLPHTAPARAQGTFCRDVAARTGHVPLVTFWSHVVARFCYVTF